ncbi:MAG: hypothetical protein EOP48_23075, partial [Sphingobacteriales bacterium]
MKHTHLLSGLVLAGTLLGAAQAPAAGLRWQQTPSQAGTPITGRIVDEKGDPLPGANVIIKGTATGTATNIDGQYTINAP